MFASVCGTGSSPWWELSFCDSAPSRDSRVAVRVGDSARAARFRLRSASALTSAPSSSATLLSHSHVNITTTADNDPHVLLYEPNLLT